MYIYKPFLSVHVTQNIINVKTSSWMLPYNTFHFIYIHYKDDTFNVSLKSYNDASLKHHGLAFHCISLHIMTLILSVILLNQNYDIHSKRHSILIMFQSNNLTMTLI